MRMHRTVDASIFECENQSFGDTLGDGWNLKKKKFGSGNVRRLTQHHEPSGSSEKGAQFAESEVNQ